LNQKQRRVRIGSSLFTTMKLKKNYLDSTPVIKWDLDDFGAWCKERSLGKAKMIDHMKRSLERCIRDENAPTEEKEKATKMLRELKSWKFVKNQSGYFSTEKLNRNKYKLKSDRNVRISEMKNNEPMTAAVEIHKRIANNVVKKVLFQESIKANQLQGPIEDPLNNPFLASGSSCQKSINKTISAESNHVNISSDSDSGTIMIENLDDDNGMSSGRKKTDFRREWFIGLGIKETVLNHTSNQWIVDAINVSYVLLEYRKLSIEKASENVMNDEAEILITGIRVMFNKSLWESMFKDIGNKFTSYELSDRDIIKCHTMSKQIANNVKGRKSLLRQWQREIEDDQEDVVLEVFESMQVFGLSFIKYLSPEESNATIKEDTFFHKYIAPLLDVFFAESNLFSCTWSTNVLDTSAYRKYNFDPILKGKKPDFGIYSSYKGKIMHLLVVEVKPPCKKNSDDLIKLGNEMKDIIDKCIDDEINIKNIVICGLLIEGFQCNVFAMDLEYEATYRLIFFGRFYFPRSSYDLSVLSRAIENLMRVKDIVVNSAELFHQVVSEGGNHFPDQSKMKRESFHTSMRIPL
ncbi:8001_t:CDS:10, partial [Gigaspora margarita]